MGLLDALATAFASLRSERVSARASLVAERRLVYGDVLQAIDRLETALRGHVRRPEDVALRERFDTTLARYEDARAGMRLVVSPEVRSLASTVYLSARDCARAAKEHKWGPAEDVFLQHCRDLEKLMRQEVGVD